MAGEGTHNPQVAAWQAEISAALKREKVFRAEGQKCVSIFEAEDSTAREPFAILYSNTETMLPALYNSRPIPYVKRRFDDADPLGKVAAEIATRTLRYLIEAEDADYDPFDRLMTPAVLQALVVNRGVTRYRHVPKMVKDAAGNELVESECVLGEEVLWNKFIHGFARTWKKVPWIGFQLDLSKEDAKARFPDHWQKLQYGAPNKQDRGSGDSEGDISAQDKYSGVQETIVWEIWDKRTRKVYFVSSSYGEDFLDVLDDPLGLVGFFPVAEPLNLFRKISTLTPTPLYSQYKEQAIELNKLTVRLKRLIEACKIRGFYNSTVEGIDKVLKADDNELIPLENAQSMPDGQGVDKLIWLMPLEQIVQAVQVLYQQREQCKQVIYEITGVSDILRGSSVASETATAQNIKNQWGTLRLKRMQKEVQRYARDGLAIIAEIAVTKLDLKTLQGMTNLGLPTNADKQKLMAQYQQLMQQAQMMAQQAGPQAPPPPKLPDPSNLPTWEDALALLKNDLTRAYRVDIETNSTIDAEAAQDKQDISELMNALSQFLNGVAPLVEKGTMPFEVAQQMMLAIARRFNFGSKLEEYLEKMGPPPAPGPDPKIEAETARDKQAHDLEMQAKQADIAIKEKEAQIKLKELEGKLELMDAELAMQREELDLRRQDMQNKAAFSAMQHQMKMQQAAQRTAEKKPQSGSAE
jgi:hypothetical protein